MQHLTLRSDDETLYHHDHSQSSSFALLRYTLAIHSSGNALSILATYPLSEVAMSMELMDDYSGDII